MNLPIILAVLIEARAISGQSYGHEAIAAQRGHQEPSSDGMDCGYESLHHTKAGMDDLGQKGHAPGGAESISDSPKGGIKHLMVHIHSKHVGISRRGRDNDLFIPPFK